MDAAGDSLDAHSGRTREGEGVSRTRGGNVAGQMAGDEEAAADLGATGPSGPGPALITPASWICPEVHKHLPELAGAPGDAGGEASKAVAVSDRSHTAPYSHGLDAGQIAGKHVGASAAMGVREKAEAEAEADAMASGGSAAGNGAGAGVGAGAGAGTGAIPASGAIGASASATTGGDLSQWCSAVVSERKLLKWSSLEDAR